VNGRTRNAKAGLLPVSEEELLLAENETLVEAWKLDIEKENPAAKLRAAVTAGALPEKGKEREFFRLQPMLGGAPAGEPVDLASVPEGEAALTVLPEEADGFALIRVTPAVQIVGQQIDMEVALDGENTAAVTLSGNMPERARVTVESADADYRKAAKKNAKKAGANAQAAKKDAAEAAEASPADDSDAPAAQQEAAPEEVKVRPKKAKALPAPAANIGIRSTGLDAGNGLDISAGNLERASVNIAAAAPAQTEDDSAAASAQPADSNDGEPVRNTESGSEASAQNEDDSTSVPADQAQAASDAETPADQKSDGEADDDASEYEEDTADGSRTVLGAFDITIRDEDDAEFQPGEGDPILVSITLPAIGEAAERGSEILVYHIENDGTETEVGDVTVQGSTVSFPASGFSVYEIVAAPAPFTPGTAQTVQDLTELSERYNNSDGFFLSYNGNHYITSVLNTANGVFVEKTRVTDASRWYLEAVSGQADKYYIFTKINGAVQYIYNTDGNFVGLTTDGSQATAFEFSCPTGTTALFLIKKAGENKWLQHSNGGGGIRFYTDANNAANTRMTITYASSVSVPNDYYQLDGKTFSIAYHEESVKGAGLTSQSSASNKLDAVELLVRPDVLNSNGELLIAQDSDLTDWTFACIEGAQYYITTRIGGTAYYLTLGNNISLKETPTADSVITVESGTDEYAGKYKFSGPAKALTLSGGKATGGFVSASGDSAYSWLNLVTKSVFLDDDDFVVYSAEKVDLADRTMVPDGANVVLYTRKWNDTTKKYEFYAVNYEGSIMRCFESGGMIQWVGSTINTMVWEFSEYLGTDGTPNFYYQLKNLYPGGAASNCIRPSADGSFLRTESAYPNYFDRSINLNGRRYGYYYSTILAWDDPSYAYIGLRGENIDIAELI